MSSSIFLAAAIASAEYCPSPSELTPSPSASPPLLGSLYHSGEGSGVADMCDLETELPPPVPPPSRGVSATMARGSESRARPSYTEPAWRGEGGSLCRSQSAEDSSDRAGEGGSCPRPPAARTCPPALPTVRRPPAPSPAAPPRVENCWPSPPLIRSRTRPMILARASSLTPPLCEGVGSRGFLNCLSRGSASPSASPSCRWSRRVSRGRFDAGGCIPGGGIAPRSATLVAASLSRPSAEVPAPGLPYAWRSLLAGMKSPALAG
mmetsp:Transcript_48670/g.117141  ORF Transcript_48670/g.117141 Transcript_48670/m.117141 type:complete len:264 (+) Transcript_48670:134-925(+)